MAATKRAEIHVDVKGAMAGLREFDKETRLQLPRELKKAAEIIVKDARGRVPSISGDAAAGIKARSHVGLERNSASASVVESRKKPPYLPWLDFGSRTPRTGNLRRFGPWTRSGAGPKRGRFLYPAIDAKFHEVRQACIDAVNDANRRAGF